MNYNFQVNKNKELRKTRIRQSANYLGANQWTGFYMEGTSIMKEFFKENVTYLEEDPVKVRLQTLIQSSEILLLLIVFA